MPDVFSTVWVSQPPYFCRRLLGFVRPGEWTGLRVTLLFVIAGLNIWLLLETFCGQ
jgi:hypothetical protein